MLPQNNILASRIQEIKDLIAGAKLEEAIKRLIDLGGDFHQTIEEEAILHSQKFSAY